MAGDPGEWGRGDEITLPMRRPTPPPRRPTRGRRLAAGALVAALALCALGGGLAALAGSGRLAALAHAGGLTGVWPAPVAGATATAAPVATATAVPATPTAPPVASATPPPTAPPPAGTQVPAGTPRAAGPQPITGATIGGTQDAFTAAFGRPTMATGTPHYAATVAGVQVDICWCAARAGTDGAPRAESIALDPAGDATWDDATALQVAARFIPPDARPAGGGPAAAGAPHVDQSADLAASFPAAAFATAAGATTPPGTFTVSCDNPSGPRCTLIAGG